jgi:hypothetical protein
MQAKRTNNMQIKIMRLLTQTSIGSAPTSVQHCLAKVAAAFRAVHRHILPLLAQTSMDSSINSFMDFITKVNVLIGVVVIVYGGWNISRGETERGLVSLIGGFIIALAVPIMRFLVGLGGTSS